MATEYDAGSVFFSNQRFGERPESDDSTPDRATATQQYREFIRSYRDDADVFIYRCVTQAPTPPRSQLMKHCVWLVMTAAGLCLRPTLGARARMHAAHQSTPC